jgi:hypothetical protein
MRKNIGENSVALLCLLSLEFYLSLLSENAFLKENTKEEDSMSLI